MGYRHPRARSTADRKLCGQSSIAPREEANQPCARIKTATWLSPAGQNTAWEACELLLALDEAPGSIIRALDSKMVPHATQRAYWRT